MKKEGAALRNSVVVLGLLLILLTSGCAIVTTYGKEPEKLSSNTYQFEFYYNIYSSGAEIDKKAEEIIKEIKNKIIIGNANTAVEKSALYLAVNP